MVCVSIIWIIVALTVVIVLSMTTLMWYLAYKDENEDSKYFHKEYCSYYKKYNHMRTGLQFYLDVLRSDTSNDTNIRSVTELTSIFRALIKNSDNEGESQ